MTGTFRWIIIAIAAATVIYWLAVWTGDLPTHPGQVGQAVTTDSR